MGMFDNAALLERASPILAARNRTKPGEASLQAAAELGFSEEEEAAVRASAEDQAGAHK